MNISIVLPSLVLLATPFTAGLLHRPFIVIAALAIVFTGAFIAGKSGAWRLALARKPAAAIALDLLVTLIVQALLTAVLYFIGYGIASLVASATPPAGVDATDAALVSVAVVAAVLGGFFRMKADGIAAAATPTGEAGAGMDASGISDGDPYEPLIVEAVELGADTIVMPVRIFALARKFADMPDPAETIRVLQATAFDDDSMFVRRMAYTALRFIGRSDVATVDVPALILRGLDDPHPWVRYDAVWAGDVAGLRDEAFQAKLAALAGDADPADTAAVPTSDAAAQLRMRAARTLAKLKAG